MNDTIAQIRALVFDTDADGYPKQAHKKVAALQIFFERLDEQNADQVLTRAVADILAIGATLDRADKTHAADILSDALGKIKDSYNANGERL